VERSKAQFSTQASNELQQTITRLENELSIKRQHESLNEQVKDILLITLYRFIMEDPRG